MVCFQFILFVKLSKTLVRLYRVDAMNFIKRALTSQLSHSSRPSRKCLFSLRPVTQSSMYSTTYRLNNPQPRNPRTQKHQESSPSPSSSSLTWSQRVKKQAASLTDWPRPSEIPYQAKVANLVNLIGHITTPVKFQSTPDGKHLAGAVISQENDQSFFVPVVFEGDLAHVVASHVKINDCVYVIGRLSEDPLPFVLNESQGNFHVVVENINFVQGFHEKPFSKKKVVSMSANDDFVELSFTTQESGKCEPKISQTTLKCTETVKNGDTSSDPWRDLVKNPSHWRDYREQKVKGSVKGKYPDFKHKDSGTALWLDSAPKWALQGLQSLNFDVEGPKQMQVEDAKLEDSWKNLVGFNVEGPKQKQVKDAKAEDSWKSLVESPNKWWDNRLGKKNAKAPDFKHKETGEALWLNSSPGWVLSKLPQLKEKRDVTPGK